MSLNHGPDTGRVIPTLKPYRPALVPWVALFFLLALSSCGDDRLDGWVVLSGSSTMAPLIQTGLVQWKKRHPLVDGRVEAVGSDAGLERLLRFGDSDFALVSRSLTSEDQAVALGVGRTLIALPLAWDAVCLVVPSSNTWAQSLSTDQARAAFTTASRWSELDGSWPASAIHRFVLGSHSGTTDVFARGILQGPKAQLFASQDVQISEDDQVLARGITDVEGSIGFLGWTAGLASRKDLKILALDGVKPSPNSVRDESYGLRRQLWLVTTKQTLDLHPAARSFLRYLYDNNAALISEAGLIPLPASESLTVQQQVRDLGLN